MRKAATRYAAYAASSPTPTGRGRDSANRDNRARGNTVAMIEQVARSLGADIELHKVEDIKDIIGYGSAFSRIRLYDVGYVAGRADQPGLTLCTTTAVSYTHLTLPTSDLV